MLAADRIPLDDPNPASSNGEALAWKGIVASAEPFLDLVAKRLAQQIGEFERDIAAYAEYALTNQGKQLRPALVAMSGGATGTLTDSHALAAVIVEMVHLATLVHDDVMDGAQIRRGRPTLAAMWGSEISVLLGDCLFAHALKLAAGFPTTEICRAVSMATNTVCSGEILQTQRRRNFELSRSEYFKFIQMKTGELFALSCDLGACLSGATASHRLALRQFGMSLGTAYQIYDDCLDLFGREAMAGKSLGTDLAKGKLTLPVILAIERGTDEEKRLIERLVRNWDPVYFPQIAGILQQRRCFEGAKSAVAGHLGEARRLLLGVPESASRKALFDMTDYLEFQTEALGAEA
jgi:octaprenyl-diphosphate synthase